ncbi:MAG: Gfo/Idh/MocA family oxidoreductase [Chloroflexota bacterium]|nr:Gfo/Idh/MocA family oxidoreductase [Chloroflexota bacterium]
MSKLRVAVIGVGAIATDEVHGHIPNYKAIDDVEVVAISDINGRRAQFVADRFDIPQVYTHFRDMLAHTEVDAVSIAAPNFLHSAIAVGCLEQGVHVLVEKPMALTVSEARRMIDAAEENGMTLFVGMNNRFRDDTRALKLMVQQGALGDVYYAKAGWLRPAGSRSVDSSWFTSKAQAGEGPLWDTGLVMLDLSLWMLGFPTVRTVSGVIHVPTANADARHLISVGEESPYPVEDSATALIRFEGGRSLMLEVSNVSMLGVSDDIYLRLDGTEGGAELHNPEVRTTTDILRIHGELFGTRMEFAPVLPESPIPSHRRELQHFVDVVLGREEPLITPEQGFMGVEIIEAIYRSAQLGQAVTLPLAHEESTEPPEETVAEMA